jgi:RNA polymerase sigma-70 factor (ECF subfamily)
MEQRENRFKQLVEQHIGDVLSFVAYLIPQREDAEDVAQDVFMAVCQNLERYDAERASFKTWLLRIAYHTALKRLRDNGRMQFVEMEEDGIDFIDEDVANELLNAMEPPHDRVVLLEKAVKQLSEDDQLLLTLYYHDDKPLREIAYITDRSERYLYSRLQWLRKKICTIIIKLEKDGKEHEI